MFVNKIYIFLFKNIKISNKSFFYSKGVTQWKVLSVAAIRAL